MGELTGNYKVLTLEDKKNLKYGDHVYTKADGGNHVGEFLSVKVNGSPKTWKRQPERVQIPYKYGLYEYGYITENDEVRVPIIVIDWQRCPSVTPGGKPYFWTGLSPRNNQRAWVVWDRIQRCWTIEFECLKGGKITLKEAFKTPEEAMKYADEGVLESMKEDNK